MTTKLTSHQFTILHACSQIEVTVDFRDRATVKALERRGLVTVRSVSLSTTEHYPGWEATITEAGRALNAAWLAYDGANRITPRV